PMRVRGELASEGIVTQALLAKLRSVQPIGELNDVLFAGFWGRGVVIADAQENRKVAEGIDLVADKVVPSGALVIVNVQRTGKVFRLMLYVFVEIIDGTVIAKVPVKVGS